MFDIDKDYGTNRISLTKGDTARFSPTISINGSTYTMVSGDTLVLTVIKIIDDEHSSTVLTKTFTTNSVVLSYDDFKDLDSMQYYYKLTLNTATGNEYRVISIAALDLKFTLGV